MKTKIGQEKIDWDLVRKNMARMINGSQGSDIFNISRDNGHRFVVACEMNQRLLFSINWTKETILETLNPITNRFEMEHWIALTENTQISRIREYAIEACLIGQIDILQQSNWKIYDWRSRQIGRILQMILKFPDLLKKFPDEIVAILEKGFLQHAQKMNALTGSFCAQLILVEDFLVTARAIRFESLIKDFARIKKEMLAELPRLAQLSHSFFIKEMSSENNYYKASVYHNTTLFKLLFSWVVWKQDAKCTSELVPMIQESLYPEALLPFFEILLACDEAKRGNFRIEMFNQQYELLLIPAKEFLDDYGISLASVLKRDDFARIVRYWGSKIG